eukprot:c22997_g2_i1 orf=319-1260(-)
MEGTSESVMDQNHPVNGALKRKVNKSRRRLSPIEELAKFNELRSIFCNLTERNSLYCSDSCLHRYLQANNWNLKKSQKMLNCTIKWRDKYKPEEIMWEDVAKEAETGKIYRGKFRDKQGRPVLVMRPAAQNTNQLEGQIRYLVYCMENAILNLPSGQEQMVWLVDFKGWNLTTVPVKTTRETAHILQDHYPERLAYAILYNPPKIFETFWTVVKPFLDPKTFKKVKFVYAQDAECEKLMDELFDMDVLECAFGGRNPLGFDKDDYSKLMQEDDIKMALHWNIGGLRSLDLTRDSHKALDTKPCTGIEVPAVTV